MTVKEAIERLRYDREMCYFNPNTGETGEPYDEDCKVMADALDIAIKALEIEPVGDCISRQTAIDDAHSQIWYRLNPNMKERIDTWLVNLPSVTPKSEITLEQAIDRLHELGWIQEHDKVLTENSKAKAGKWSHDGSKWANRYICSECGYKLFDEPTNYCPNCGAKMESE